MTLENLPDEAFDRGCDEGGGMGELGEDAVDTFRLALVHELRAPLQVLQGQLDVLAGAVHRAHVDNMRKALGVLTRVVDDVLHLGQQEGAQMPLVEAPFEVRASVDGELALFAAGARTKGLLLHCDIDDEVPVTLHGDATRLRQILRTLLANALKYTMAGEIHVRASWRASQARLTLRVTDTGPGIPVGARDAIFRAFFRANQETTGTGLGLWIARRWADRMGGVLVAESAVRGAHFRLSLPLSPMPHSRREPSPSCSPLVHADEASARPAQAASVVCVAVRHGLKVLVVDDHPINRRVLCDQLAALGCAAHGAADVAEALTRWASCEVDVVLTDVQLGQASGLQLAEELRQLAVAQHRQVPVVIAVTGSVIDARSARDAGIDAVLTKPVSGQRLRQVLSTRWPEFDGSSLGGAPPPSDAVSALERRRKAVQPLRDDAEARRIMRREMATDMASFRRLLMRRRDGDLDAAQLLLHRMQGACRMFGDPELLARCEALAAKLAAHREQL